MTKIPPLLVETSLPWGGRTVGDAADFSTLNDDELMYYLSAMAGNHNPRRYGVLYNTHSSYSGNLATTNPSGTTVRISSGAALVWQYLYLNDANVDFSCPNKGYYHIALRCNTMLQTVRLIRLGHNTQGYPRLTRTDTINDLSIALVYNDGASLTITDSRRFFRNVVINSRYSDYTDWGDPGSAACYPVVSACIVCGSHPPESIDWSPIDYSDYPIARDWESTASPIVFLQAQGEASNPGATHLVYRDILSGGAWYNPVLNYRLDSIGNISAVWYLAIGPTDLSITTET